MVERWLTEVRSGADVPAFPNRFGKPMTRSGVEDRLARAVTIAAQACPSLSSKAVSPHTLRHSTAMHLLQSGVDVTVIALWLGHESPETTHQYVEADLEMKRRVLDRLDGPKCKEPRRAKPSGLVDFLNRL
jgi:site-specific recombinase XerD